MAENGNLKAGAQARVWQFIAGGDPDQSNTPPSFVTYQREAGVLNGTTIQGACQMRKPNGAQQYVVPSNSPYFTEECRAMEGYAKKHGLVELDFSQGDTIGSIPDRLRPKPPKDPAVEALEVKVSDQASEIEKLTQEKAALLKAKQEIERRLAEVESGKSKK